MTGDFSAPEVAVMFQFSVRGGDSFTSQNLTVIVRTSCKDESVFLFEGAGTPEVITPPLTPTLN